jgi:hypothetical protein
LKEMHAQAALHTQLSHPCTRKYVTSFKNRTRRVAGQGSVVRCEASCGIPVSRIGDVGRYSSDRHKIHEVF